MWQSHESDREYLKFNPSTYKYEMQIRWGFFIMGAGGAKFLYSASRYVAKTVKAKTQ